MESKYFIPLIVLGIIILLLAVGNEEVNDLCDKDFNMLVRLNGEWACSSDSDLGEDLRFPISSVKLRGTAIPEEAVFIGDTYTLAFDKLKVEQGYITLQLPHSREASSDLEIHFHWSPSTSSGGNVSWCVEYTCANRGDTFPSTSSGCVLSEATGLNKHTVSGDILLSNNLSFSAVCQMRLYRNGPQAEDNYNADAYLHEIDLHYKAVILGRSY